MPLPVTFFIMAPICESCRHCLDIPIFQRLRSTRTCLMSASRAWCAICIRSQRNDRLPKDGVRTPRPRNPGIPRMIACPPISLAIGSLRLISQATRGLAFAIIAAGSVAVASATAQTQQERRWCAGEETAATVQRIEACSSVIRAAQDKGESLAEAYNYRGLAYRSQ